MRLKESQNVRQHLLLSILSATPLIVEDIRHEETWPGLHSNGISLLYLLEMIIDDWVVEINETGTKLKYKPGVIIGGRNVVHDCGLGRSIGYFLEPLIVQGLFGKKPLHTRLKGAYSSLCLMPTICYKCWCWKALTICNRDRHIRDFLGVKFVIEPDPVAETEILKCVGCGLKNLSRKFSCRVSDFHVE